MDNDITSKLCDATSLPWPEFKDSDILEKGTLDTPFIALKDKILYIQGNSKLVNGNAINFYNPLMEKAETLALDGKLNAVNVMLKEFNISGAYNIKILLETVVNGACKHDSTKPPKVNWYYEKNDESIREAGEDYARLVSFPFKFIEINGNQS